MQNLSQSSVYYVYRCPILPASFVENTVPSSWNYFCIFFVEKEFMTCIDFFLNSLVSYCVASIPFCLFLIEVQLIYDVVLISAIQKNDSYIHTDTHTHIHTHTHIYIYTASQVALVLKNLPVNAGDIRDAGSIPQSGRSPGGGPGNPLQYSFLEYPMDRGAWWAAVHRDAKSPTRLRLVCIYMHTL